MASFGALSLVPPLLAIALAIVTRRAVLSLFLGIWAGGIIHAGGPTPLADPAGWLVGVAESGAGLVPTFEWIVAGIVADEGFHAQILVFTLLLGAGVAMLWNLGGSHAVRDWALDRVDSRRKAGFVTWLLGLAMFFDDYANTAVVGSTMKDVSDELRISREKLSYLVDSTAAPVATIGISSWVAFQLGLIADAYDEIGLDDHPSAFEVFLESIPYNAYALLAIVMVAIVVGTRRDFGEMLDAEHRAQRTGRVYRADARPMQDVAADLGDPTASTPRLTAFFAPVVVLVVVTVGSALATGYEPGAGLYDAVIGADYAAALVYGSFAMVASGFVLGHAYGIMGVREATDAVIDGFGIMLTAVSILVLAWGIGEVVAALETGEYVSGFVRASLPVELLAATVLLTAAFVAFSTGTSWGTMAILTPIVVPVAWSLAGDHTVVAATVGAIFSGAILGDHASPISDTTVLSATFTGADLIDHVRTQLYYAATVGLVATGILLVWGYTRLSPFVLVPAGAVFLLVVHYVLSELDARWKGLDPVPARATPDEVGAAGEREPSVSDGGTADR